MDLLDFLDEHSVFAGRHAADAYEAIELSGRPLVDTGVAEERYIQAMQEGLREFGPYMVLAPGIAMPHARPEGGAIGPGFSVVTLDEPVKFGHQHNDPVDLLVAFSATDKEAHVTVLKQLALLFGDQSGVERIRAATSDHQLIEVLRELVGAMDPDDRRGASD